MLTLDLIYKASTVLKDVVRRTQLIPTQKINPEANVFLKPENSRCVVLDLRSLSLPKKRSNTA